MANLERIYTIPLADAYEYVRTKRARRAVKLVQEFALRHMKAEAVRISEGVNSLVFRDGMQKPPRRIKVRIVKGDDALARVWLVGEEEKIKELADRKKKEEEARKKEAEKKEEKTEAKPSAQKTEQPKAPAQAAPKQEAKPAAVAPAQKPAPAPAAKPALPAQNQAASSQAPKAAPAPAKN